FPRDSRGGACTAGNPDSPDDGQRQGRGREGLTCRRPPCYLWPGKDIRAYRTFPASFHVDRLDQTPPHATDTREAQLEAAVAAPGSGHRQVQPPQTLGSYRVRSEQADAYRGLPRNVVPIWRLAGPETSHVHETGYPVLQHFLIASERISLLDP